MHLRICLQEFKNIPDLPIREEELTKQKEIHSNLSMQKKTSNEANEIKKKQIVAINKEIAAIRDSNNELIKDLEMFKMDNIQLESELTSLETELYQLRLKTQELKNEIHTLQTRKENVSHKIEHSRYEIQTSKEEMDKQSRKIEKFGPQIITQSRSLNSSPIPSTVAFTDPFEDSFFAAEKTPKVAIEANNVPHTMETDPFFELLNLNNSDHCKTENDPFENDPFFQ